MVGGAEVQVLGPEAESGAIQKHQAKATSLEAAANALVIVTPEDYERAGEFGVYVQTELKNGEDWLNPTVSSTKTAYDKACEFRDSVLNPIKSAKATIKAKMETWKADQRRKAEEAQRDEVARLRAEEESKRLAQAASMEEAGFPEMAAEMLEQPVAIAAPVPNPSAEVPKVSGTVAKVRWDFLVVHEAGISREYLIPDLAKIRAVVKAEGPAAQARIGGIQVVQRDQVDFRKKKS